MTRADIPLFPLKVVLFPGGHLTLRIFEQRYIDMVRECTRKESGFGIVLVVDSGIPEQPVWHSRTGTRAEIRDFFTHDDGLLGITVEGGPRFRVHGTRMRDSGLLIGEVEWLPSEHQIPVPEAYSLLVEMTRRFAEVAEKDIASLAQQSFDDASWVSFRLAELLPLEAMEQQRMLECVDAIERLQLLLEAVPDFQPE